MPRVAPSHRLGGQHGASSMPSLRPEGPALRFDSCERSFVAQGRGPFQPMRCFVRSLLLPSPSASAPQTSPSRPPRYSPDRRGYTPVKKISVYKERHRTCLWRTQRTCLRTIVCGARAESPKRSNERTKARTRVEPPAMSNARTMAQARARVRSLRGTAPKRGA